MTDTTLAPTDAEIFEAAKSAGFCFHDAGYAPTLHTTPQQYSQKCFERFARALLAKWGAPAPASGELVAEVMFDERKYIQYTIPLELLPVGAKFYTAQEVRVPLTEKQISKLWSDAHNDTSDRMAHQVLVRLVETTHGITAAQKETP